MTFIAKQKRRTIARKVVDTLNRVSKNHELNYATSGTRKGISLSSVHYGNGQGVGWSFVSRGGGGGAQMVFDHLGKGF